MNGIFDHLFRSAMEKPAQPVVKTYLEQIKDTKTDFYFRNNVNGLRGMTIETTPISSQYKTTARANGKKSGTRPLGNQRTAHGDLCEILAGEYKAAHKVHGLFSSVLQSSLSEVMFVDTLRWLQGLIIMKPVKAKEKK
ncbi:hypothetical protein ACJ72_05228 [Emergomyces africanus]|uniref:Uncharacterized protein n=1 Tax=Emergomyces africanus TaxID=1955775 RepID=A0A1B7NUH9_9EURO|nr:hypothetical protein ACJ72_05228 [Emergomyces africanus]